MKKILFLTLAFVSACSTVGDDSHTKYLTQNIPSTDKFVREGRPLESAENGSSANVTNPPGSSTQKVYSVVARLYDTVWYRTERKRDLGRLEQETKMLFFDNQSNLITREIENGKMDEMDENDFETLTVVKALDASGANNIAIARAVSRDGHEVETEYKAFWLVNENELYMIDENTLAQAEAHMDYIIKNPTSRVAQTARYLLSTQK